MVRQLLRTFLLVILSSPTLFSQEVMMAWTPNLTDFPSHRVTDQHALQQLSSLEDHPEYGILPYQSPCESCAEVIEKRTPDSRYFISTIDPNEIYSQQFAGTSAFHDPNGFLRSLDPRLYPAGDGLYRSTWQYTPSFLDIPNKQTGMESPSGNLLFNRDLELIHRRADGTEEMLGLADWSQYTVGENGIKVTDIWPGIDLIIAFQLETVKSNFEIRINPGLTGGQLIIRDHLDLPAGYSIEPDEGQWTDTQSWRGNLLISAHGTRTVNWTIDPAYTYDASGTRDGQLVCNYELSSDNALSVIIPIHWMNDPSLIYPLTIDPLVTSSATYSSGSMEFRFNGEWCGMTTNNCIYSLTVTKPANCTITGATFAAEYRSVVGAGGCGACWMSDAGFYMEGPCGRSPISPFFWSCNLASTGTCSASGYAMDETVDCLTPECNGTVTFDIFNSYCYCAANGTDCTGTLPCQRMNNNTWSITLKGHNLETLGDAADGSGSLSVGPDCCITTVLDPTPDYGVPPYTYVWTDGSTSSDTTVFSCGDGVWVYTCDVTDACGITRTATFTMTVDDCGVLPIELVQFSAVPVGQKVLISWKTESEWNNLSYLVEHSADGFTFHSIGEIAGAGNSAESRQYELFDENPVVGTNYYRLTTIDTKGESNVSGLTDVLIADNKNFQFFPNPFYSSFTLVLPESATVCITSSSGQVVWKSVSEKGQYFIDGSKWPDGLYQISYYGQENVVQTIFKSGN